MPWHSPNWLGSMLDIRTFGSEHARPALQLYAPNHKGLNTRNRLKSRQSTQHRQFRRTSDCCLDNSRRQR